MSGWRASLACASFASACARSGRSCKSIMALQQASCLFRRDRIKLVRQRYESLISETPDADAFAIIASEIDSSSTSFRAAASKIAQINTLESFMARYRDNLEDGVGELN